MILCVRRGEGSSDPRKMSEAEVLSGIQVQVARILKADANSIPTVRAGAVAPAAVCGAFWRSASFGRGLKFATYCVRATRYGKVIAVVLNHIGGVNPLLRSPSLSCTFHHFLLFWASSFRLLFC